MAPHQGSRALTLLVLLAATPVPPGWPLAAASQEVITLGGFVKMSAGMAAAIAGQQQPDLSVVRVQLLNAAGHKAAEGECSPNGYYFVPLESASSSGSSSYTVRVHGPPDWVFSPQQVREVQGVVHTRQTPCSLAPSTSGRCAPVHLHVRACHCCCQHKHTQTSITCDARGCNGGADVNFELSGLLLSGRITPGAAPASCKVAGSPPSFAGVSGECRGGPCAREFGLPT
jgi:hypothetical protein